MYFFKPFSAENAAYTNSNSVLAKADFCAGVMINQYTSIPWWSTSTPASHDGQ